MGGREQTTQRWDDGNPQIGGDVWVRVAGLKD
jgi:hypothetical protein